MLEVTQRTALNGASVNGSSLNGATVSGSSLAREQASRLSTHWCGPLSVVNLRLDPANAAATAAVAEALGLALPLAPCTACGDARLRIVWAGPDDWFLIGPAGLAADWIARLSALLAGTHHALTDVSSGYRVLQLSGSRARELLAQGCPLDLHPRVFRSGMSAGTVFFKASVWLWQTDDSPHYEVLVRSSFQGYVQLLIEQCRSAMGLA
jgi:sarcosine oxidase, subunit gamma